MDATNLWDIETPIRELGVDVPAWIDQDIDGATVAAIVQGGCESGAYMPAVTYHEAVAIMAEHGDDVVEYLRDHGWTEVFTIDDQQTFRGFCCNLLSAAVESFANDAAWQVEDYLAHGESYN